MRILFKTNVFGSRLGVEPMVRATAIPNGQLTQTGTSRVPPDLDSWAYSSPWFTLSGDDLDRELMEFLSTQHALQKFLIVKEAAVKFAMLTICPVAESEDEAFACLLSVETLAEISRLGLALEIAPAPFMPDAPTWRAST